MSERNAGSGSKKQGNPGDDKRRTEAAKSFLASVLCVLGIVVALGAVISIIMSSGAFSIVSAGAISIGLGVAGFFLGANRLGTVTIVVSITALFFGLAASQGLIPELNGQDRTLPDQEPAAKSPDSS
ncbi:MAG: hypothetical protein M3122_07675 [Actinomycetota bacterium]|nr:hypothetical protein [Actinomycetota bacterium]